MDELIEQTRIYTEEKPGMLPAGQQLATLKLPETEAFKTKDWRSSSTRSTPASS